MKAKLQRLIEKVIELRDAAHDDEVADELDDAILSLEAANDRLIQMEEEDDDDEDEDDQDDEGEDDQAEDTWNASPLDADAIDIMAIIDPAGLLGN